MDLTRQRIIEHLTKLSESRKRLSTQITRTDLQQPQEERHVIIRTPSEQKLSTIVEPQKASPSTPEKTPPQVDQKPTPKLTKEETKYELKEPEAKKDPELEAKKAKFIAALQKEVVWCQVWRNIVKTTEIKINSETQRPDDCADLSMICNNLYLGLTRSFNVIRIGSFKLGACQKNALKSLGVTHILTIGTNMDLPEHHEFKSLVLKIDDTCDSDITQLFDVSCRFIYESLSGGGKVFVHCWAGVSRSSTIIVNFLMTHFNHSYIEALEITRRARYLFKKIFDKLIRFWIDPNRGFRKALIKRSKDLGFPLAREQIKDYESCAKLLREMHLSRTISTRDKNRICSIFEHLFGTFHQYTMSVKNEVDMFYSHH